MEELEKTKDRKKQKKCRGRRKDASLLIMLMLIFSCITATFARSTLTVNASSTDVKAGDAWYSVLSESAGTVQYKKPAKKHGNSSYPGHGKDRKQNL